MSHMVKSKESRWIDLDPCKCLKLHMQLLWMRDNSNLIYLNIKVFIFGMN